MLKFSTKTRLQASLLFARVCSSGSHNVQPIRINHALQLCPIHSGSHNLQLALARIGRASQIRQVRSSLQNVQPKSSLSGSDSLMLKLRLIHSSSHNMQPKLPPIQLRQCKAQFLSISQMLIGFAMKRGKEFAVNHGKQFVMKRLKNLLIYTIGGYFVRWGIALLGLGVSLDLLYTYVYNYWNEYCLIRTFELGTRPDSGIDNTKLIPRESLVKELKLIFQPVANTGFYRTIISEHGTGTTSVVRRAAREVGQGVIYVEISDEEKFSEQLAKALGWSLEEKLSFTTVLKRKFLRGPLQHTSSDQEKMDRVMKAFERGVKKYQAKFKKPPVLILDNISKLGKEDPELLKKLQHFSAGESTPLFVFVTQSEWHRANVPFMIGDLSGEEALKFLQEKLGIDDKKANQLIKLVGGRIMHLKDYGKQIQDGQQFELIRENAFSSLKNQFSKAEMLQKQSNLEHGKRVIQELLKRKQIKFGEYCNLVGNERVANQLLSANVFSFDPVNQMVSFQSPLMYAYVQEVCIQCEI
ncbi:hypothetical protein BC937DRAFT_92525 [Endogone sp. FLAS-F59071]|nr:hypothetical protein BC937DRAFT_92525 [Endogone sp. FLAS-F59071]|eukprot:RUS15388.1 hypothetical protein BC937DRAFT_92525 [Endogone sp. FLAS-F59071]